MNTDNHLAFCLSLIVTFISFRSIPRAPMMWPASRRPPAYQEFSLRALATQRRRDAPCGTYPGPNALPEDVSFLSPTATHNSPQRCWRVIGFLLCCPKVELDNSAEQNPEVLLPLGASVSTRLHLIQIIIAMHPPILPRSDGIDAIALRLRILRERSEVQFVRSW